MKSKLNLRPSCNSLDGFFAALMVISAMMLLYSTFYTYRATDEKNEKEKQMESLYTACNDICEASELFTEESRQFVIDYDLSRLNRYWDEAEKEKTVEKSMEYISESGMFTVSEQVPLEDAREKLYTIRKTEAEAMLLVASAHNIDERALPVYLKEYEISDNRKRLSADEKIYEARLLLYGESYKSAKADIESDLQAFRENIDVKYQAYKKRSTALLHASVTIQITGLTLLLVISSALFLVYRIFCSVPLQKNSKKADVSGDIALEEKGFAEICTIASRYNENMKKSNDNKTEEEYNDSKGNS